MYIFKNKNMYYIKELNKNNPRRFVHLYNTINTFTGAVLFTSANYFFSSNIYNHAKRYCIYEDYTALTHLFV